MPLRVMSWNIHSALGAGGRRHRERVARVVEEIGPDLAGLQEVSGPAGGEPLAELGRLVGMRAAFGPTLCAGGVAYGNAILSRHPIEAIRTYDLSVRGREPRGCLRADVSLGDGALHIFACHLGLHWRERRRQAALLLSADILRDAALAYPLVLVGDFNTLSSRSAVPRWLRSLLVDCAAAAGREAPTFPSAFPLLRLDRAYVGPSLRVLACQVYATSPVRQTSDHLPLVVDLHLEPSARRPPPARPIDAAGVHTAIAEQVDAGRAGDAQPWREGSADRGSGEDGGDAGARAGPDG